MFREIVILGLSRCTFVYAITFFCCFFIEFRFCEEPTMTFLLQFFVYIVKNVVVIAILELFLF